VTPLGLRSAMLLALLALAPRATPQSAEATAPPATLPAAATAPETLIGLDPAAVFARLGTPHSLYVARGAEPWQDDAVFSYDYGLDLYWYRDRVWQVGLAKGSLVALFGLKPGDSVDKAFSLLGQPAWSGGNPSGASDPAGSVGTPSLAAWEWSLPNAPWPLRLRAVARADGVLEELYAYRADF